MNVYMRMPQRNSYCHPFDGSKLAQRRIEGYQRDPGSCCRGDGNSRASCQDRSRSSRYSPKRTSVFTCGLSVPTSHFQMPPVGRPLRRLGMSRADSVALSPRHGSKRRANARRTGQPYTAPCFVRRSLDRRAERILCMSGAICCNAAMPKKQGERQNRAVREVGPSWKIPINRLLQAENSRLEFA